MKPSSMRRMLGVSFCAGLLMTGITPAMGAGDPTTAITTKLPAFMQYLQDSDVASVNYRPISGTYANTSSDQLRLMCINAVSGDPAQRLQNITGSKGKWSSIVDLRSLYSNGLCRLLVVPGDFSEPSGTPAQKLAAYAKFTGPTIAVNKVDRYYNSLGVPGSTWSYDAVLYFNTKKAAGQIWSTDDGGIWNWAPIGDSGTSANSRVRGFFYRDSGSANGPTGSSEASMTVDGAQAFTSYSMSGDDFNMTSKSSETVFSLITDPKTGASTFTQSNVLFKCTKPETASTIYDGLWKCPNSLTTKLPVSLVRTIKVNADGNVANVTEMFKTLDKKAHSIRYDVHYDVNSISSSGYRYAKTGDFGDALTAPKTKIAGYGYKYDRSSATSSDNPIIQVVYPTVPTTSWMNGTSLYSRWNVSIPKGKDKSVVIKSGAALISDDKNATAQITLAGK